MRYKIDKSKLKQGINEMIRMEINNLEKNLISHVEFVKGAIRVETSIESSDFKEIKKLAIEKFPYDMINIGNHLASLENLYNFLDRKKVDKYEQVVLEIINEKSKNLKNYIIT